ncbi:MAG: restriction endonuclease [Shimia sp.]
MPQAPHGPTFCFILALIGLAAWPTGLIQAWVALPTLPFLGSALGVMLGAGWLALVVEAPLVRRRQTRARAEIAEAVARHQTALRRNLARAVKVDDYGTLLRDDRPLVLLDFCDSTGIETEALGLEWTILELLDALDALGPGPVPSVALPTPSGRDFELWVEGRLRQLGWVAAATPAARDQGIDVIAQGTDGSFGIQCKLTAAPVGNAAVQEAAAGRIYHGLDQAAVVATGGYTPAARDLAASTGVLLWSPDDLPRHP